MSVSRILKWVTGSFEAILAIPLIGASIVVGSVYIALAVMLILHIFTLVFRNSNIMYCLDTIRWTYNAYFIGNIFNGERIRKRTSEEHRTNIYCVDSFFD